MRKKNWGRFVGISSNMVGLAIPGMSHYIASKMGIIGFMRGLANDVADDGITANAVLPGLTTTLAIAPQSEEQKRATWGQQAIKRLGEPRDVTGAVLFLTSDDAAFITGQAIVVDGGQYRIGGIKKEGRMGSNDQDKIRIAREYFMRADQGRPDVLELFHEDAEIYFPKFGFGFGRQSFFEMAKGFERDLEYIQHDYDSLTFIPSGDYLVVEGTSHGRMSGKAWAGGKTSGGRFCNVFKFREGRISSLHIHLDPDYTGEDEVRFRWGKDRQW